MHPSGKAFDSAYLASDTSLPGKQGQGTGFESKSRRQSFRGRLLRCHLDTGNSIKTSASAKISLPYARTERKPQNDAIKSLLLAVPFAEDQYAFP